jgi:uncharacterized repeat protein (TIGR04052 family)
MRYPIRLAASWSLALVACGDDDGDPLRGTIDASTVVADASAGLTPGDAGLDGGGLLPVTLRFKGKIGSEELACGQRYTGLGSTKIAGTVRDFRFFVHDVRLVDARGVQVPVQLDERPPFQSVEVAMLDFTDGRGSCLNGARESNLVLYGQVPAGTYTGIRFTTGVPEALNHADPTVAPESLKASPGVLWTWRQGYRFVLAELDVGEGVAARALDGGVALADAGLSGDGSGLPGLVFAHVGSLGCSGSVGAYQCRRPNRGTIELTDFDLTRDTVVADLGAVFEDIDLLGVVQCHGDNPVCEPALAAFGIDPGTGAPAAGQRVFRIE